MKDNNNIEINSVIKNENKFFTKDKICFFVIGLLFGAIIASAAFLIYANANGNNNSAMGPGNGTPPSMMEGGTPPSMPDDTTPPEMPDGETPPELPDGEAPTNNQSNSNTNAN